MIIVKLSGGLGNQMFQCALANTLGLLKETTYKVDISAYDEWDFTRKFELQDAFKTTFEVASVEECNEIKNKNQYTIIDRITRKIKGGSFPYYRESHVREQSFFFDPKIFSCNKNVYIDGYWQSEKYFREDLVKKTFDFYDFVEPLHKSISKEILSLNAISIHFRRGDYVEDLNANSINGICSMEYYTKSVDYFRKQFKNAVFVVFSDDIGWVKSFYTDEKDFIFVESTNSKCYEDMKLMSLCKHNIIANSTYSWWGARLNDNSEKIVIAPEIWFKNSEWQNNAFDIIPRKWIKF